MKEQKKEDLRIIRTRQKVLKIAAQLLFTYGWSEVTHLSISRKSGIARGTLYRHWPTVDDLIVDIFVYCDWRPYAAQRTGDRRADLIAELTLLSTNLESSKLGNIILNAARLAKETKKMAIIHQTMHEIILKPFFEILNDRKLEDGKLIENSIESFLVAPVLYHHLFSPGNISLNFDQIVDHFLARRTKQK